jgi:hypothetical protein
VREGERERERERESREGQRPRRRPRLSAAKVKRQEKKPLLFMADSGITNASGKQYDT